MADMEKVIKELESLRDICNAKSDMTIGKGKIAWAGYANTADDAIVLLKEQQKKKFFVDSDGKITPLPDVVRCKDCAYRGNKKKCIVAFVADKQDFPFFFYDNHGEWFCADGSRKDGEANG